MELGKLSMPKDLVKCCDCGCDCSMNSLSPASWIRSVKRKHEELVTEKPFDIPELNDLDIFSTAKVQIENECEVLRETVSNQQESIQELYDELEKERNASATATEEAMSMILRLQNEKAEIKMELRQFKVYAKEKMEHDQEELMEFEDLLYQRDQTIQSLTYELQAFKHGIMSSGMTEAEADLDIPIQSYLSNPTTYDDEQHDLSTHDYPPLKCNINENQDHLVESDIYVTDKTENYPPIDSPHGIEHLKSLDQRISQMESNPSFDDDMSKAKGRNVSEAGLNPSPSSRRHFKRISTDGSNSFKELKPDIFVDSPKCSFKKVESVSYSADKEKEDLSEIGDDRVYTIDSIHQNVSQETKFDDNGDDNSAKDGFDIGDSDIKKLYMRLQALEADRESMKQVLISMSTERAQMVLSNEVIPQRNLLLRKTSIAKPMTSISIFKWITSFLFWRRKALRSKYMYGISGNNTGLKMLLEKVPRARKWRCLRSTQV